MGDVIRNVPYNNPSLIPLGDYDIDILDNLMIEIDNEGSLGKKKGNYHVINKCEIDGREIIFVDMVTLKKVLDMKDMYPKMKKGEVMTICQLRLSENNLEVWGDIVKVKDNIK